MHNYPELNDNNQYARRCISDFVGFLSVYLPVENLCFYICEMDIRLNNEPVTVEGDAITLSKLLQIRKYTFRLRIVKINGRLIDRNQYDNELVKNGDEVQVVYLMSGG